MEAVDLMAEHFTDQSAVDLRGVNLIRSKTQILSNINWQLPRGSTAALLGPNGSGKTTLTRVILGYEWPTSGSVRILGQSYGQTDLRQLRQRIALVNPSERFGVDPNLTAQQAVLTGYFSTLSLYEKTTPEQRDHADELLTTVGMMHRRDHRFGLLSTGEQRRVLLARALVVLPEILILDEPTAGLDVRGRENLLATLATLKHQKNAPTMILVTHHVEEIPPGTQQVIMLKQGEIAALGTPDEVITPESLSDVFGCKVFVQKRSGRYWLEVLPEAWLDLLNHEKSE